jgi:hypothetical protein
LCSYLGVKYTSKNLTFPEIRADLAKLTSNEEITVPTLDIGKQADSNQYLSESFKIAEYVRSLSYWPDSVIRQRGQFRFGLHC